MILSICEMPEVLRVLRIVNIILLIIRIVVPIILMVSAMIDLVRAVQNAELNKITKPMVAKVVAAILIFMIPVFIRVIAIISGNNREYEKCLKDISTETINAAFNDREEGYVSAAEESNDIHDYNVAIYNLINIKDQEKRKEFEERLAAVKEIIDERDKKPQGPEVLASIVEDSKFDQYQQIASCYSDTLKYRIIQNGGNYYAIIWAQNPNMQMNSALATNGSNRASAETILSKEISAYGYGDKCLIATNASFFNMSNGSIISGVVLSHGQVLRNSGNATSVGITSGNILQEYIGKPLADFEADGVRNNFTHSHAIQPSSSHPGGSTNRTVICQVNTNNFVLISGRGESSYLAYVSNSMTGDGRCFNLDGGGSRKLYYKTKTSSIKKQFGGDRQIPDMIYFAE